MRILALLAVLLAAVPIAPATAFELSDVQRQWLAAHKTIRVAPDPDLAPIDGRDKDGAETGLAADYLKLIVTRTGLRVRTASPDAPDRGAAMRALRERQVDIVPAAVANAEPGVLYSAPYLRISAAIYARAGEPGFAALDQLAGHAVAVVESSPWPALVGAGAANIRLTRAADRAAALAALADGRVDAFVGDPFTTADAIARAGLGSRVVLSGQLALQAPIAIAVRSDWPLLRQIIDAALKDIGVDEEKALRARWLKHVDVAGAAADTGAPLLPQSVAPAIDAALRALARAGGSADARKPIEDLLQQARDDDSAADQLAAQWQDLSGTATHAAEDAQKLEDALATRDAGSMLAWRAALPERATVEQLEALLARERDALASAKSSAAALQAEVDRQLRRPGQMRSELAAAQAQLDQNGGAAGATGEDAHAQAQALRARAAARKATIEIALLNLENRSYEARMRLLAAQLRERKHAADEETQRVAALENLVLDRTGAAIGELRTRVARERDQAVAQFRMLGEASAANLALVDKLDATVRALGALRTQKQDWENWQRDTAQALKNTEERIRIGGVNEAVGLILLAEKAKLKPLPLLERALLRLQTELAQTRMNLIDLREQQDELGDLGSAVTQSLAHLPEPPPERLNDLRTALYRLLDTRAEILPSLLLQQNRLAAADAEAEQTLRDLVAETDKLGALLDARLLWTPSHKPVDTAWLLQLPSDLARFLMPRRWLRVGANVGTALANAPLLSTAALALLAALLAMRPRIAQRLGQIAAPMRRIRTDRYRLTGQALLWTVVAALPLPLALWLLGHACRQIAAGNGNLTEEAGLALSSLAPIAFALTFLRALLRENGLAQYHFRWPRPRRDALRRAQPWLLLCVLPAQFVIAVLLLRADAALIDTFGRATLALATAAFGALTWYLLAPGRVWTSRDSTLHEPLRLRQALRVAGAAGCAVMTLLVLRGYFVTVATLARHMLMSLAALLAIATAHGLAARWLVLGERRLALRRMIEKSAQEQRERGVDGEAMPEPEPEEITVASVGTQTRRLLRAFTIFAAVAALLWIWSEVTPAVALLDEVPVWKDQHVSLLGVVEAFVVLALTWIATRNLPGLLEVGLLRRMHIDAATRYAITSVTRYVIVFAGTIGGLSLLGLHWSNLQWLAAGFSVGLGFGLQEIFANFVSGLMVLFERPIRVGDVITIGTVEGTVARIRTRATTIIDADNREVIVPNKSFITERLVNWTLSDTITRLVIKVGVAYRNDPRRTQQLLLEIAAAHPQVLAEPAAGCWMTGFGESTQDFELRVYVAELGQRNAVRNELQLRIVEVFRANDIEIAFPQMDVWLRNAAPGEATATATAPA
jgi:potassium efflux system protein